MDELLRNSKDVGVDTSDIEIILKRARKERMEEGINLIPSENVISKSSSPVYACPFSRIRWAKLHGS